MNGSESTDHRLPQARSWLTAWWCLTLLAACSRPSAVTATPSPPEAALVATWDGGSITADELRAAVRRLSPSLKAQFDTPEGRIQFIDALVAKRLLTAAAKERQLDTKPEIRAQVAELEERLLIQAYLAEVERDEPAPTEAELRATFEANPAAFRQSAAVNVARVLIYKGDKPASSKAKLERLRLRLLKGEAVSRVARDGEGAERTQNGDIGWLDEATSPIGKVALALERAGQVSPLIELEDAWACVVALEVRPARTPAFEEVKEQVASRFRPTHERRVFNRAVKNLVETAGVRLNPGAVE